MQHYLKARLFLFALFLSLIQTCGLIAREGGPLNPPTPPWYTGSLLAESPINALPGQVFFQPYLIVNAIYGNYKSDLSIETTSPLFQINPAIFFQTGLLPRLDIELYVQTFSNYREGHWHTDIGDTFTLLGFQVATETATRPAIRLTLAETFPTGRFDQLSSGVRSAVEQTGIGSYQTQLQLDLGKQFYPSPLHPLRLRINLSYTFFSNVTAKGLHIYGGREGGKDAIFPGDNYLALASFEYSFTPRFAFALDSLFSISEKTKVRPFDHTFPTTTMPLSWNLSFAPALEYSFSETTGIIGGIWFSALGKNSTAFASLMLSVAIAF